MSRTKRRPLQKWLRQIRKGRTLSEIAAGAGLSKERVRQLLARHDPKAYQQAKLAGRQARKQLQFRKLLEFVRRRRNGANSRDAAKGMGLRPETLLVQIRDWKKQHPEDCKALQLPHNYRWSDKEVVRIWKRLQAGETMRKLACENRTTAANLDSIIRYRVETRPELFRKPRKRS